MGSHDIYALGDVAHMETPKFPSGQPQVANVAINQAKNLANNLRRMEMKSSAASWQEFEYHDKGSMATVGRNLAVVDIPRPKLQFGGFVAWLIWMGLHLVLIVGVKNRILVFINWVYNYLTYDQSLRLIFKVFYKPKFEERKNFGVDKERTTIKQVAEPEKV
jgi:NADH dehydrogenase